MLDATRLATFRSVVANGTVQAAADQLRLTPSAVSQQVAALQKETGLTLLERVGRGVRPTPAGMTLAVASGDALRSLNRLTALVRDLREGKTGHLVIGHFASAGQAWMPDLVARISREFPDIMVQLVLTDIPGENLPTKPDIDVRIALAGEGIPVGMQRIALLEDPFVMCVHKSHPLARKRTPVPLADFAEDRFVANDVTGGSVHAIQSVAYAAAGFSPRTIVEANDHRVALAFVDRGIGISMLPGLAAGDLPPNVRIVQLADPVPHREIYALVRTAIAATPAARRVVELLHKHAAASQSGLASPAYR
ncbi:putative LysR-family transcriptional regulator [Nostocoides australiense Ben110]|uniref:Putative LysR-family transcriptional regulator n=1 Tax=Nostocoides australiense Ben110 TaxID=1193182 RepID=W6JVD6_9MICO|nr:LysR family transcriptional regulator [Tetrasphaera australiensis]CCH72626.1 putative LysR-family transcriptional regulator [Tetrasphaera australiensis Ben110]